MFEHPCGVVAILIGGRAGESDGMLGTAGAATIKF
jgi:hypothetical protein